MYLDSEAIQQDLTQNEYEFYMQDAEGVQILTLDLRSYRGRARAVQGGTIIFLPAVKIEDLK